MGVLDRWRHCPECAAALDRLPGRVECPACGFVHYAHSGLAVAGLVVDDRGRLLLARRAVEPDAGRWDTPGGFLEEGEDPLDGLRRELLEETGLEIEVDEFAGAYVDRYGAEPGDPPVLNLVWHARVRSGEASPADDVSELRWFAPDELPADEELAFRWLAPCLRAWAERTRAA
ncbi:MAG TPA: NUDIX hydrolase [Gaiellaceae bacterium]|nr:NUDIX hydrolase [Gaiellaceae bacterium]